MAEKVTETVFEKEVSCVRVKLAAVGVQTDPLRLRVHPVVWRVSSAGGTITIRSSAGEEGDSAKGEVRVRVKEEGASRMRVLAGV